MDVHDLALQVVRLPSADGVFPQSRTENRASANAIMPLNPLKSATQDNAANTSELKTEVCRNFWSTGKCRYGDKCIFAHGSEERRKSKVMNPSTNSRQICRFSWGKCPFGKKCIFQHKRLENYQEKRDMPLKKDAICMQPVHGDNSKFKTKLCNNFCLLNSCNYGSKCRYAHGQAELRSTVAPVLASESGNAQLALMTSVKYALPNHRQTAPVAKHKLPPRVCLFKWKRFKKIASIYADWINEESFEPCELSEH